MLCRQKTQIGTRVRRCGVAGVELSGSSGSALQNGRAGEGDRVAKRSSRGGYEGRSAARRGCGAAYARMALLYDRFKKSVGDADRGEAHDEMMSP